MFTYNVIKGSYMINEMKFQGFSIIVPKMHCLQNWTWYDGISNCQTINSKFQNFFKSVILLFQSFTFSHGGEIQLLHYFQQQNHSNDAEVCVKFSHEKSSASKFFLLLHLVNCLNTKHLRLTNSISNYVKAAFPQ